MQLSLVPLERAPRRTGGGPCLGAPKVEGSLREGAEAWQGLLHGALGQVRSGLLPRGQVGPRPPRPRPHGMLWKLPSRFHESSLFFISRQRRPTASRKNLKKPRRKYAMPSSSWPPWSDAPPRFPAPGGPRGRLARARSPLCRLPWAPSRASSRALANQNTRTAFVFFPDSGAGRHGFPGTSRR